MMSQAVNVGNQEVMSGRPKVTSNQVAIMVDRYLCDSNFLQSSSVFRSEASSVLGDSAFQEVPRGLLTLRAILDEYVQLKDQKVKMDKERCLLEQEWKRVDTLLQGLQGVMGAYKSAATTCFMPRVPPIPHPMISPSTNANKMTVSPAAGYRVPGMMNKEPASFSASTASYPRPAKRRNIITEETQASKKHCNAFPSHQLSVKDSSGVLTSSGRANVQTEVQQSAVHLHSSTNHHVCDRSLARKPSTAKSCVIPQTAQSPKSSSPYLKTPTRAVSFESNISSLSHDGATAQEAFNRVKGSLDFGGVDRSASQHTSNKECRAPELDHGDVSGFPFPDFDSLDLDSLFSDYDMEEFAREFLGHDD